MTSGEGPEADLDTGGLDAEQLRAVTHEEPSLCVLAAAGSGKTRVLTRRVAYRASSGTADPAHCLVLTFTRKAATELRERLGKLGVAGVTAGTFHAIAYSELRQYWLDSGRSVPVVSPSPVRHVENALASLRLNRSVNARSCLSEISWAKAHGLNHTQYVDAAAHFRRRAPLPADKIAKLWQAYEAEKKKRGVVDFDDLLLMMVSTMRQDRSFADLQRWKYRHFFVDEFQDLNRAQFNLLRAWLGLNDDLFVVGDPNQAIYGFNGADASFLLNIHAHFPDMDVLNLTTNYRSTPQVLAAGDAVLGERIARAGVPGQAPTLRQYADEHTEAAGIARQVRVSCGGKRSWNDAAVLVRTNAQRGVIEDSLVAAGIPVRAGGGSSWMHRVELKEILDYLRANEGRRLIEIVGDLGEMASDCEAKELAIDLVDECRLRANEDVNTTVRDAVSHLEVSSRFDAGAASADESGVTVTTFHRAKGLEWPVVLLAGLEDGLVPLGTGSQSSPKMDANSGSGAQLEEERRLLYVAITRAKEELHCSFAARRTTTKGVESREPSRWMSTLAQARIDDGAMTTVDLNAAVNSARRSLAESSDHNLDLRDSSDSHDALELKNSVGGIDDESEDQEAVELDKALRQWRASRSKLTHIEPQLILSDETIDLVARVHPRSVVELSEIDGVGPVKARELWEVVVDG